MERSQRAAIVDEARKAFRHNAEVFVERPNMYAGAVLGTVRVGVGLAYGALASNKETKTWLGKLGVVKINP